MPVEITQQQEEAGRIETRSPRDGVSMEHGAEPAQTAPPADRQSARRRRLFTGALAAPILIAVGVMGVPWIRLALDTVSTDDAYVNGHVTFVAPRVSGQIARVLVDDNNRVKKGDVLVQLDKEPYQ